MPVIFIFGSFSKSNDEVDAIHLFLLLLRSFTPFHLCDACVMTSIKGQIIINILGRRPIDGYDVFA